MHCSRYIYLETYCYQMTVILLVSLKQANKQYHSQVGSFYHQSTGQVCGRVSSNSTEQSINLAKEYHFLNLNPHVSPTSHWRDTEPSMASIGSTSHSFDTPHNNNISVWCLTDIKCPSKADVASKPHAQIYFHSSKMYFVISLSWSHIRFLERIATALDLKSIIILQQSNSLLTHYCPTRLAIFAQGLTAALVLLGRTLCSFRFQNTQRN